ncbi:MAG: hypothetical protein LBM02_09710 [Lachnospiraceae bacterium]|jgi:hypothetical protein|nr:hypothetical protein [Lachnospiraceae bacterium]
MSDVTLNYVKVKRNYYSSNHPFELEINFKVDDNYTACVNTSCNRSDIFRSIYDIRKKYFKDKDKLNIQLRERHIRVKKLVKLLNFAFEYNMIGLKYKDRVISYIKNADSKITEINSDICDLRRIIKKRYEINSKLHIYEKPEKTNDQIQRKRNWERRIIISNFKSNFKIETFI